MNFNKQAAMGKIPEVVLNLIIINVLVFLASIGLKKSYGIDLLDYGALHYFNSPEFRPYQIVTHFFMHGNLTHILFNMFGLYTFGSILERVWLSKKFLFYYIFTALGAALCHTLVGAWQVYGETGSILASPDAVAHSLVLSRVYHVGVVGASGALMGLLVAFARLFPNAELFMLFIPFPVKAKYMVGIIAAIDVFGGFASLQGDIIAHFAHLGGMIFGLILLAMWGEKRLQ